MKQELMGSRYFRLLAAGLIVCVITVYAGVEVWKQGKVLHMESAAIALEGNVEVLRDLDIFNARTTVINGEKGWFAVPEFDDSLRGWFHIEDRDGNILLGGVCGVVSTRLLNAYGASR